MLKKIKFQLKNLYLFVFMTVTARDLKSQKNLFLEKSNTCSNWSLIILKYFKTNYPYSIR